MSNLEKQAAEYSPATDILEMEDGFHILMDLPGVRQEDLTVDIEESELTIKGVSSYAENENGKRRMHTEFGSHTFARSFTLSDMVDRENVKAELKNGVLQLYLPKAEAMKPRRIMIS